MDAPTDRARHYAVGLRKRLQKDALRVAGLRVEMPRYALLEHVHALLADIEDLPVQHGLKPRTLCSSCLKVKPATLHWTAEALSRPHGDDSPASFAIMCRTCAGCRDKLVAQERMRNKSFATGEA